MTKEKNSYWIDTNVRMNIGISLIGIIILLFSLLLLLLNSSNNIDYSIIPSSIILTNFIAFMLLIIIGTIITLYGATTDFSIKVEIKND